MDKPKGLITILKTAYKPILVLAAVIIFFLSYNTYLVDRSLDNLRVALDQTKNAKNIGQVQALDNIIDYALITEITPKKIDSLNLAHLTLTKEIISKSKSDRQLDDIRFALDTVINDKEAKRGSLLTALDKFVKKVRESYKTILGRKISPIKARPLTQQDLDSLGMAKTEEEAWHLEKAISLYQDFLYEHPDYEAVNAIRLRIAYCYQKLRDFTQAQKLYDRIIQRYPDTPEAQLATHLLYSLKKQANLKRQRDDLEKKIKSLKDISKLQEAYYTLGILNNELLDLDASRQAYEKVIEMNPDTELALKAKFNLGWSYKFQGKLQESSQTFKSLTEEHPESKLSLDSKFQIADNLKKQGKFDTAIEIYQQINQEYKDMPIGNLAQFQTGYTYLYDLNDPAKANREFQKLSKTTPYAQISQSAKKVMEDSGKDYRLAGEELIKKGLFQEAIIKFNQAIKTNPYDGRSYASLGLAHAKTNRLNLGLEDVKKALELTPDDDYVQAQAGNIYTTAKNYDAAIGAYTEAIRLNPEYIEALYNLGYLYLMKNKYTDAIKVLTKVVKLSTPFPEVHNNLGVAYWKTGKTDEAVKEYLEALKIAPGYLEAHYNLGMAYKTKGDYQSALDEFNAAVKISPTFYAAIQEIKEIKGILKK